MLQFVLLRTCEKKRKKKADVVPNRHELQTIKINYYIFTFIEGFSNELSSIGQFGIDGIYRGLNDIIKGVLPIGSKYTF